MGCLIYVSGNFVMQIYKKILHKKEETDIFAILFAGILFTTWYAQLFSIFYRVSLCANIVLIVFAVLYTVINRFNIIKRIFINHEDVNTVIGKLPEIKYRKEDQDG